MHKMILLSRTYQLSSDEDAGDRALDPNNESLWRFDRRRLDAEAIRDSLLAVSGTLDRTMAGPHPFPPVNTWGFTQHAPFQAVYETKHRSVYLMTQRQCRQPYLALFDGADANASTAERSTTTVPTQALFFLNDPLSTTWPTSSRLGYWPPRPTTAPALIWLIASPTAGRQRRMKCTRPKRICENMCMV